MSDETAPPSVLTCTNCGAKNRIRPSPKGVPTCGRCKQPLPWLVDATDAVLRGGQPVDRIGALPKEQLVTRLAPHLAPAA